MPSRFCLDWHAGPSASLEVFSPPINTPDPVYQVKYTPAFRATIRPPVERCSLGPNELAPINEQLEAIVRNVERARGVTAPGAAAAADNTGEQMETLGNLMLQLVVPDYIQADLRVGDQFLDLGIDESLLDYPWELMHDGEDFLCLKHSVGRFVNNCAVPIPSRDRPASRIGSALDPLRVLIVSVPHAQPRDGVTYPALPGAEAEADALVDLLTNDGHAEVSVLAGHHANFQNVFRTLRDERFHILHFTGHAQFNDAQPRMSGLVLIDKTMTTGAIANFVGRRAPFLCVVNACETGKVGAWKDRYSIFGLARAFLDTGAYLVGSRWKVSDAAAPVFARQFYEELLIKGRPLGTSLRDARRKCRNDVPADKFAWASYVLYGDPRVCFRNAVTSAP